RQLPPHSPSSPLAFAPRRHPLHRRPFPTRRASDLQRPPPPARGLRRPRAVRGRAWRGLLPGCDLDARGDRRVIRVLIVDDEAPARALLREMLSAEPDVEILGEAATGLEPVKPGAGR